MSPKIIIIYVAIAAVAALAFIWWQAMNAKRAQSLRSEQRARKADRVQLRGQQKKIFKHAMTLAAQQNHKGAAQLLESLGMYREAVQILETNGLPREAAAVLMRLRRPNRAGVILERAQLWKEAAQCYALANLPVDVARCAREAGDLSTAADGFLKAGKYEDAAECLAERGDHQGAARIFLRLGKKTRAIELYQTLVESTDKAEALSFGEDELTVIAEYLREGNTDPRMADILVIKNRLAPVILDLVRINNLKSAAELYLRSTTDIGPQLIGVADLTAQDSANLAQLFLKVSRFEYAGIVFERLGDLLNAGHAFRNAEEFERAALCYERSGKKELAVEMRIQLAQNGGPKAQSHKLSVQAQAPSSSSSPFSMQGMGDTNGVPAQGGVDSSSALAASAMARLEDERADHAPAAHLSLNDAPEENTAIMPMTDIAPMATAAAPAMDLSADDDVPNLFGGDAPTVAAAEAPVDAPAPALSLDQADGAGAGGFSLTLNADEAAAPAQSPADRVTPIAKAASLREDTPSPILGTPAGGFSHPAAFRQAKFCEDLSPEQVEAIWELGQSIEYGAGETILDFADEPKGVYFILSGEVSCHRRIDGQEEEIDRMASPSTIGEFWLLVDMPTQVKFVATNSCHVRIISRDPFNDLLDKHGSVARTLYKRFTQRLIRKLVNSGNDKEKRQAS